MTNGWKVRNTPESFWAKVEVLGPEECWPWTGQKDRQGYGVTSWNRKNNKAHRLAYQLHYGVTLRRVPHTGKVGDAVLVLHRCDNPSCCNPEHLWLGSFLDNNRDCISKGRHKTGRGETHNSRTHPECVARGERHGSRTHPESVPRGENHHNTPLTERDVRIIRERISQGDRQLAIARAFGITQGTVSHIKSGKTWKHI